MSMEVPDFDVLLALHRYDPQALEQLRKHMLRLAVESAPSSCRPSLEQLLLRIEAAHDAADSPSQAALIAFRMMGDSVSQLHEAWGEALHAISGMQTSLLIERVRQPRGSRGDPDGQ